jgi:hypothetical protein
MRPGGCDARRDFWPERSRKGWVAPGGFYAPFVLNRFTDPSEGPDGALTSIGLSRHESTCDISNARTLRAS